MNAPIAIFVYNRPEHTVRLLNSLKDNSLTHNSHVRIYCDGAKKTDHEKSVELTRQAVKKHAPEGTKFVIRDKNMGLANSIITGVTELCDEYGTAIILEDDLILSKYALSYLNKALDKYKDNEQVMHVSAYMYPVKAKLPETFFYTEATCWGWATWKRAWDHFDKDANSLIEYIESKELIKRFNIDGSMYFYQMLRKQRDGKLDSWAIRWYASMFKHDGLALHPAKSLVLNEGFDGSGVHCNIDKRFKVKLANEDVNVFPDEIAESISARKAMVQYRKGHTSLNSRFKTRVNKAITKVKQYCLK